MFCEGLGPITEEGELGCRRMEALGGQQRLKRDPALRVNLDVNLGTLKVSVLANRGKYPFPWPPSGREAQPFVCVEWEGSESVERSLFT